MRKILCLFVIVLVVVFIGCGAPVTKKTVSPKPAPQKVEAKVDTTKTAETRVVPTFAVQKVEGLKITILFPLLSPEKFGESPHFALYAVYACFSKADSTWARVERDDYEIETTRIDGDPQHVQGVISLPTDDELGFKANFFTFRVEGREKSTGKILLVPDNDLSYRKDATNEPGCEFGYIVKTGKVIVPVPQEE